ncbi:hypothetical protein K461DRAFT_281723 [Myriangium duriaei CBS 260.36]|uniref:D-isomer specific 2-hydroxyacid dehydrogenase NAD-binding domain-containing protein n=1 Tax=Myriangium duriaei CBS 260.36 TaxID=1168546 RepID=A0A9P4IST6_9PEZI|nr:hypothetical protein K461DRAFT_281723 [Myriangium duriaei CBS 260.36]
MSSTSTEPTPTTSMKHKLVCPSPPFRLAPFSFPCEMIYRENATPEDLLSDIADATIVASPFMPLTYDLIVNHAPKLQMILCQGSGTDHVSHTACRERGITLCNTPAQGIASVSEHAFALLGALKRRIVPMHNLTMDGHSWADRMFLIGDWAEPPRTNADEVMGVVGYGALGKGVEKIAKALGMTTLIAERKGAAETRAGRTAFEDVLKRCTVLVLTAPLDDSTRDMIATPELGSMQRSAMLVNVGRGGLVDEAALVRALKERQIAGAATDVFAVEPATKQNSTLLDPEIPNLLLSPHVAWYSKTTIENAKSYVHGTIEAFVRGEPRNVVIEGRKAGHEGPNGAVV